MNVVCSRRFAARTPRGDNNGGSARQHLMEMQNIFCSMPSLSLVVRMCSNTVYTLCLRKKVAESSNVVYMFIRNK